MQFRLSICTDLMFNVLTFYNFTSISTNGGFVGGAASTTAREIAVQCTNIIQKRFIDFQL